MFERFTDKARKVVVLAQEEARLLMHNYIGTEHLLLGLIHEGEGVAAKALTRSGVHLEPARQQIVELVGKGPKTPAGHIPFTPRTKKSLEMGLWESKRLGHNYIGTEHILLGLIHEAQQTREQKRLEAPITKFSMLAFKSSGEGVAVLVLERLGATLPALRATVVDLMHGHLAQAVGETLPGRSQPSGEEHQAPSAGPHCPQCNTPLEHVLAYRILEASGEADQASASVLLVYCGACGRTLDSLIAPDD